MIDPETYNVVSNDEMWRKNQDFSDFQMMLQSRAVDLKNREMGPIQNFIERQIKNFENLKFKKNRQFMEGKQVLVSERLPSSDVRRQIIDRELE